MYTAKTIRLQNSRGRTFAFFGVVILRNRSQASWCTHRFVRGREHDNRMPCSRARTTKQFSIFVFHVELWSCSTRLVIAVRVLLGFLVRPSSETPNTYSFDNAVETLSPRPVNLLLKRGLAAPPSRT